MALILNIETATSVCSVALGNGEKLLLLKEEHAGFTHSEKLTSFIRELVENAGIALNDVHAIAVSSGPGSYTGLRIGVSTAKGICFALDKPLISVPTLKALAAGGISKIKDHEALYCPMIDARRMEVYCAVYDSELNEVQKTSAEIINEGSFSDLLNNQTVYFFGDGADKSKQALSHQEHAVFAENIFPSAEFMVNLAYEKYSEKKFEDVSLFEPYYLKDFVATKKSNTEK